MSEGKHDDRNEDSKLTEIEHLDETELVDEEVTAANKIKLLRDKLKSCEDEKRQNLEDIQRAKADFLNAKKRIEEDKIRDSIRLVNSFIEQLFPLCDSFHMAMSNQVMWESVDKEWRLGMEGIKGQLDSILDRYQVTVLDPVGEQFDPLRHEAMSNVSVTDKSQDHQVISVIQLGYERTTNGQTEVIRPARVTVGEFKKS